MTTLKGALADLLQNRDLPVGEAADRHISPGFRQRTNGQWGDRAGYLTRMAHLRGTTRYTINVLDELIDGSRYAEHHIIDLRHDDGRHTVQEVYLFATLDSDGRFDRIEEVTLPAGGAEPAPS